MSRKQCAAAACGSGLFSAFQDIFAQNNCVLVRHPLPREGAIELMMRVYKSELPNLGGYLVHGADVHLGRVEQFIRKVGGWCMCVSWRVY